MMDLLNIANETLKGFNPATDKVEDFENLPDGEYNCLLEDVTNKKSEKTGNEWIGLKFNVHEGEYAGRYIFVNYFFTPKTIARSIKQLSKLTHDFGYQLPVESFESMETLKDALLTLCGNTASVEQKTKNDFSNYKVTPTNV